MLEPSESDTEAHVVARVKVELEGHLFDDVRRNIRQVHSPVDAARDAVTCGGRDAAHPVLVVTGQEMLNRHVVGAHWGIGRRIDKRGQMSTLTDSLVLKIYITNS